MLKRISALFLAVFLGVISTVAAAASSGDSYVLDGLTRVAVPELYEFSDAFQVLKTKDGEIVTLKNPQDLFYSKKGRLFIVDSGNNRILKADKNGTVERIFMQGGEKNFKNPQGIFVDDRENLYIADTDNSRIVHLDCNGVFVEEFGVPTDLPSDDITYFPAKIAISSTGYIYVVRGQNILTLDADNRFRGYLGQTEIGFNLTEALVRLFASDVQKKTVIKRLAASYINIAIDPDNNIYATTQDYTTGELKKLNSVGTNIFHETGAAGSFSLNFSQLFLSNSYIASSGTAFYGDRQDDSGKNIKSYFIDITYDKNGIVYALDKNTCRIYIYDKEGNLLGTFGSKGIQKGKFVSPTSVVIGDEEELYVLDENLGSIQVFRPTSFKKIVCEAIKVYYDGDYDRAHVLWNEVLSVNENYNLARKGIGKTYFKQGEYTKSMTQFQKSGDVTGYSDAFAKQSYQIFHKNFALVVFLAALALAAIIALMWLLLRTSKQVILLHDTRSHKRFGFLSTLKMTTSAFFHPCDTFENVKYMRGGVRWLPSLLIAFSAVLVRIIYMNIVHFPLADIELREASYLLEGVKILLPFFTFVLASYAMTTILNGETKFNEALLASSLALTPYIFLTLPLGALSHVLSSHHAQVYSAFQSIILVWTIILLFNAIRVSNRFSVKKTMGVALLTLLVMALIWILGFLVLVMWNQVYLFFGDVLTELTGVNG